MPSHKMQSLRGARDGSLSGSNEPHTPGTPQEGTPQGTPQRIIAHKLRIQGRGVAQCKCEPAADVLARLTKLDEEASSRHKPRKTLGRAGGSDDSAQKGGPDVAIARFMYECDVSFQHALHPAFKRMIKLAKKRGYVTYEELNEVLPSEEVTSEQIEDTLSMLSEMGITVEKHHHEVASAQHELCMVFDTLTRMADKTQIYKYGVHQVAHAYGKTATFMPKPVYGDNGSGMHVHQSIWKDGKPTFAGNEYAGLSETCLYYIGGIIKHAKAINAFTNPSTNSYKRLVPGYEAPVLLAYSARNRSASCRIPFGNNPKAKRVEVRFPDPTANPYLGFAAMLMAGLDGIKNKIHPGQAMDKDLYDLPKEELKEIPTVAGSLREALESLDADRAFLTAGGVFDDDQIDAYIDLKMEEVLRFEMSPHPVEFDMYYSV